MSTTFKIGKIFGIEIGVHWSWLFIFALITWSVAENVLTQFFPEWSNSQRWIVGVVVAIIFFASILLHELSHSLVAKAKGIPVEGITLFVFGGVSRLGREAQTAGEEFQIAIVGPLTSLAIGAAFAIAWATLRGAAPEVSAISGYLALINGAIAAFNMLPGFPLDGGRVFRSIVWARNRNLLRATRIASKTGEYVAYGLMAAGAVQFFFNTVGGVWLFIIGLFLRNASTSSYEQMVLQTTLRGLSARALARTGVAVPPDMPVEQLVSELMLRGQGRCYPVLSGQQLLGLITLTDVQRLEREQWPKTSVFHVMTPFEKLHTVAPEDEALQVLQLMSEKDVNQVPVVDGRLFIGMVSRGDVMHLIQVRHAVATSDGQD
ncbi:MAG: site-2 protease family protein [Chloroflexi bacterium]|nr:site-2 protease family protein [Chloroflexota bacterium]